MTITYHKNEEFNALPAQINVPRSSLVDLWKWVRRFDIGRPDDLTHLSQHLRLDAGIDELEVERQQILKAPLIR